MTDNELIQKIKDGEEAALGLLIDRYGAYVAAVVASACGRTLPAEDVEELASDVFVAFWNSAAQFEAGRDAKPWLARTARNMTVSRLRKGSCRQEGQLLSLDDSIMILEKDGTDELVIRREQEEILNRAVANLGQPDREIFARFYFLGEKIGEIAGRLELNPATVKTKLRRSRGKLKEAFEERGYRYYEG